MDEPTFRDINEKLSTKFDVEEYLERSNFIIRFIELRRIKFVIQMVCGADAGTLLDVGCGNGFLLERLKVKSAFGVDLSWHNIAKAKMRLDGGNYHIVRANAERLPFLKTRFDAVVCSEVIEHVQNPEVLLEEISEVIKPEGIFIITIPNDSLVNKCKKIFAILRLDKLLRIKYGTGDGWHLHIFGKRQLKSLLLRRGFSVCDVKTSPCSVLAMRYIFQCKKQA